MIPICREIFVFCFICTCAFFQRGWVSNDDLIRTVLLDETKPKHANEGRGWESKNQNGTTKSDKEGHLSCSSRGTSSSTIFIYCSCLTKLLAIHYYFCPKIKTQWNFSRLVTVLLTASVFLLTDGNVLEPWRTTRFIAAAAERASPQRNQVEINKSMCGHGLWTRWLFSPFR